MNIHEVGSWNDPIDQFVFATFYDLTILSKNALDRTLYYYTVLHYLSKISYCTPADSFMKGVFHLLIVVIFDQFFFKGAKIEIYLKEEKTAKVETV